MDWGSANVDPALRHCFCLDFDNNWMKPDSREGHSLTLFYLNGKKMVCLHGGLSGNIYSDFYVLEVGKFHWKSVDFTVGHFEPRFGHTTVAQGSKLWIFGGCKSFANLFRAVACINE